MPIGAGQRAVFARGLGSCLNLSGHDVPTHDKGIYLGKDRRAAKSRVSRTVSDPIKASSCST